MAGLSQGILTIVVKPACDGEERLFKSVKQKEMWIRLHMKKCPVCANATRVKSVRVNLSQDEAMGIEKEAMDNIRDTMNSYNHLLKS